MDISAGEEAFPRWIQTFERKQKVCNNLPSPFDDLYLYCQNKMPKRTSEVADLPAGKSADVGQDTARAAIVEDDEMGEFEDRWEDEIESEHEVEAGEGEGEGDDDGGLSL